MCSTYWLLLWPANTGFVQLVGPPEQLIAGEDVPNCTHAVAAGILAAQYYVVLAHIGLPGHGVVVMVGV